MCSLSSPDQQRNVRKDFGFAIGSDSSARMSKPKTTLMIETEFIRPSVVVLPSQCQTTRDAVSVSKLLQDCREPHIRSASEALSQSNKKDRQLLVKRKFGARRNAVTREELATKERKQSRDKKLRGSQSSIRPAIERMEDTVASSIAERIPKLHFSCIGSIVSAEATTRTAKSRLSARSCVKVNRQATVLGSTLPNTARAAPNTQFLQAALLGPIHSPPAFLNGNYSPTLFGLRHHRVPRDHRIKITLEKGSGGRVPGIRSGYGSFCAGMLQRDSLGSSRPTHIKGLRKTDSLKPTQTSSKSYLKRKPSTSNINLDQLIGFRNLLKNRPVFFNISNTTINNINGPFNQKVSGSVINHVSKPSQTSDYMKDLSYSIQNESKAKRINKVRAALNRDHEAKTSKAVTPECKMTGRLSKRKQPTFAFGYSTCKPSH
jgi:hypothetical protein